MSPQNSAFSPCDSNSMRDRAGRVAGRRRDPEAVLELGRALRPSATLPASTTGSTESRNEPPLAGPFCGSAVERLVEVEVLLAPDVLRVLEGRHPAAVLQPGVPADVIDMQMGAHHHVDLVGRHARRLQPRRDRACSSCPTSAGACADLWLPTQVSIRMRLAADPEQPAMDAELQPARRLVVVVGRSASRRARAPPRASSRERTPWRRSWARSFPRCASPWRRPSFTSTMRFPSGWPELKGTDALRTGRGRSIFDGRTRRRTRRTARQRTPGP